MPDEKYIVCSDCGKRIDPDDAEKEWRKCRWCKKPVCFDCSRYIGVKAVGMYSDYIEVVRLCRKCYPEKRQLTDR